MYDVMTLRVHVWQRASLASEGWRRRKRRLLDANVVAFGATAATTCAAARRALVDVVATAGTEMDSAMLASCAADCDVVEPMELTQ